MSGRIEVVDTISWDQLEDDFRQTTLLNQPEVQPYLQADISLERIAFDSMRPTTLYVVERSVQRQVDLRIALMSQGLDSLSLSADAAGVILRDNENGQTHELTPPIVEATTEEGAYLADGAHRSTSALRQGMGGIVCVKVANFDPNYPFYAKPNEWGEVVTYDEAPTEPALKKHYVDGYRDLYRYYPNGGKLRS